MKETYPIELKSKIEVSQKNKESFSMAMTFNEYQKVKPDLIKDNIQYSTIKGDMVIVKVHQTEIDYNRPLIKKLSN
jgi:predicted transport protein